MFELLTSKVMKTFESYGRSDVSELLKEKKKQALVTTHTKLLFNPYIPPISVNVGNKKTWLGYRGRYLYHNSGPNVIPKPSDTVMEAGVYRGWDTAMYGKMANRVIAFEPSPRNYSIAKTNLKNFDNIELHNKGLWNEKSNLKIKYGTNSSDDGFLSPDSGTTDIGNEIPVNTIEEYTEILDIDTVDFLKIEAEGAEPEIIKGMGELEIEKIVVNTDVERSGKSTAKEVMTLLKAKGYNLVGMKLGCILFFTLGENFQFDVLLGDEFAECSDR